MGVALERALPLALTVFCGVVGGFYTFQPMLAPKDTLESASTTPTIADAKVINVKENASASSDTKQKSG